MRSEFPRYKPDIAFLLLVITGRILTRPASWQNLPKDAMSKGAYSDMQDFH